MTISSQKTQESFNGNGVTTVFSFGSGSVIAYNDSSELVVVHSDADGVETTLTEGAHYTISNQDCTYPVSGDPLPSGEKLVVYRNSPITQTVDLQNQTTFFPEVLEAALDDVVKNVQEIASDVERAVKVPLSSDDDPYDYMTDIEDSEAAAAASAAAAAASAASASTSAGNAATSETNAAADAVSTAADAVSTAADAVSTAADAVSTAADAATATTQAGAASTSAAAAATSETNAAASESNAATSETNAATSETNAAASETAAAASAAAAAASADAFDDTYLGAKASDPTLDNDGDALTVGDLYFNTTSNEMRVYNGSSWQVTAVTLTTIDSFNDVDTSTAPPSTNDALTWDGSNWTPGTGGGGYYKGENGTTGSSAGDIFRINEAELNSDVTISATENASCTGPLSVASTKTLTVEGTLVIL